jgi:hypothetical protein
MAVSGLQVPDIGGGYGLLPLTEELRPSTVLRGCL